MNDLVSIVIPAYNASNYLAEAIESAIAQTYPYKEIIVINDGSSDDGATREVAMQYKDAIRYFEKENGGCASALNYGIQVMEGKWFSWLSHDDLYLPEKLERLLELIDKYNLDPEKVVLGCNDYLLSESGRRRQNLFQNSKGILPPVQAFGENLNTKTMNGCGLLIPKNILDEVGTFKTYYKHQLDRELWMRIALSGYTYCYAEDPYVISRVHNQQITVKAKDSLFNEEKRLIMEFETEVSDNSKYLFLRELTFFAYKRKHYKEAKFLKTELEQIGCIDVSTRTQIIRYTVEGKIKSIIRDIYKNILRK